MEAQCNACFNALHGQCFKTQCGHIFCEKCAFELFADADRCVVCESRVAEREVQEILVGMPQVNMKGLMYQSVLEDASWERVLQRTAEVVANVTELSQFIAKQIHTSAARAHVRAMEMEQEAASKHQELARVTMQMKQQTSQLEQCLKDTEFKLQLREKELLDLQEAYKEKMRKCQAWEKAYNNVRSQLGQGGGAVSTISAAAGPPAQTQRPAMAASPLQSSFGMSAPHFSSPPPPPPFNLGAAAPQIQERQPLVSSAALRSPPPDAGQQQQQQQQQQHAAFRLMRQGTAKRVSNPPGFSKHAGAPAPQSGGMFFSRPRFT